jgi:AcrR family transcriptional regulator
MAPAGRPRSFDREIALRRAMEMFWERGYEAVSLADVASALGLTKPSIYAAFGDKEALFREAIELYSRTEGGSTERALADQPTARAAIEAVLRNNARNYTTPGKPRGCMVVLAASVGSSENEEIRAFLASIRKRSRDQLVKRVQRGIREGDVPPGADAQRVAMFYSTLLTGLSVQARDGVSAQTMNRAIDDAMALWEVVTAPRA